jgi:DNA gyrase subunit B
MSVVAALSTWLEHTNHRGDGGWTQRYEHGVPIADLVDVPARAHTGTTVRFHPDPELVTTEPVDPTLGAGFPWLTVTMAGR